MNRQSAAAHWLPMVVHQCHLLSGACVVRRGWADAHVSLTHAGVRPAGAVRQKPAALLRIAPTARSAHAGKRFRCCTRREQVQVHFTFHDRRGNAPCGPQTADGAQPIAKTPLLATLGSPLLFLPPVPLAQQTSHERGAVAAAQKCSSRHSLTRTQPVLCNRPAAVPGAGLCKRRKISCQGSGAGLRALHLLEAESDPTVRSFRVGEGRRRPHTSYACGDAGW